MSTRSEDRLSSDWWYTHGARSEGPLSDEEMRHHFTRGDLEATTLVWRSGMEGWKPAAEVEALKNVLAAPQSAGGSGPKPDQLLLTEQERKALNALIDRVGIDAVISTLREICRERDLI